MTANPELDKYVKGKTMDKMTLNVSPEEAEMIMRSLAKQPYEIVAKLINDLHQQLQRQMPQKPDM